jgi:hypothetical protein
MTHRFGILRRFRFNLPQRIAAGLLAVFLLQGLWVASRQPPTNRDFRYALCGRQTWEALSPASYLAPCGNIHDGILAYRLAGLPFALNLLVERGLDLFRKPAAVMAQTGGCVGTPQFRLQVTQLLLLLRLPFLLAGCVLGGCLWWVTRRLYGNWGGYTALTLYCFSPAVLKACLLPNTNVLAALGIYGGVYTCIGVAHAMQGPRRKWRPRIVLLTVIFAIAAAAHIAALPTAALLGLVLMLWVAEGHRRQIVPVVLLASAGALVLLFACYGFSPEAFGHIFRSAAGFMWVSLDPAKRFFSAPGNAGITIAAVVAAVLYLSIRKSRYFGNTTPLLCAAILFPLIMTGTPGSPWIWAQPFLLTFVGGVFADAYESRGRKVALIAAGVVVALQAALCLASLSAIS